MVLELAAYTSSRVFSDPNCSNASNRLLTYLKRLCPTSETPKHLNTKYIKCSQVKAGIRQCSSTAVRPVHGVGNNGNECSTSTGFAVAACVTIFTQALIAADCVNTIRVFLTNAVDVVRTLVNICTQKNHQYPNTLHSNISVITQRRSVASSVEWFQRRLFVCLSTR